MASQDHSGGRDALSDDNRSSWRPQDEQSTRSARDRGDDERDCRSPREPSYPDERYAGGREHRRWEGGRSSGLGYARDREADDRGFLGRSTEAYGQGQSGYSAGRYGDDRAQRWQNRNEMVPALGGDRRREHGVGFEDRFSDRRIGDYWEDRPGYDPERYGAPGGYGGGRGFEPERLGPAGAARGYDEHVGYRGGYGKRRDGRTGYDQDFQSLGYQAGYGGSAQQRSTGHEPELRAFGEPHAHRGTGPHRGKGPVGYQRSDERLREMICESLAEDDELDASHIEVAVKQGEVTLSGSVEDRRAKRCAEDCACSISGVRDVQNQLRVTEDRGSPAKPGAIAQSLGRPETELSQDKKHRA